GARPAAIAPRRVQVNRRSRFSMLRRYSLNRSNGFMPPLYLPRNAGSPRLSPLLQGPTPSTEHTTSTNVCCQYRPRHRSSRSPPPDPYSATTPGSRREEQPKPIRVLARSLSAAL